MYRCSVQTGVVYIQVWFIYRYLHIGVVDEGPSSWSLQDIVQEVLQSPVEGVPFGGFLPSRDAAALPSRTLLPT